MQRILCLCEQPRRQPVSQRGLPPLHRVVVVVVVVGGGSGGRRDLGLEIAQVVQRADGGLDGARERGGVGRVVQVRDAVAWNQVIANTSLPDWLSALLVNTPATEMESGFRLADGRYRQYDNIYAPDISVHVHMFSMIPFVAFHTPLVKDIVKTCQARLQCPADSRDPTCPPGMVQEVCANAGWGNKGCGNSSQNWCPSGFAAAKNPDLK